MQWKWMSRVSILMCVCSAGRAMADDLSSMREQLAALHQEVEALKVELQAAKGAAEAGPQQLQMYIDDMNRFRQDVDVRLRTLEDQLHTGIPPSTSQATIMSTMPTPVAKGTDAESLAYQKGLNDVHNGDYLGATNTFRQFIQTYLKSTMVPNAQFWIGECYFAMRDYQRAIKEYQVVVERYGRSEKANAALFKQGLAFEALGMKEEAKLFLQKLIAKAPNSPEARKAAEKLKMTTTSPAPAPSIPVTPTIAPRPTSPESNQGIPLAPGVKPGQESQRTPLATPAAPASGPENKAP